MSPTFAVCEWLPMTNVTLQKLPAFAIANVGFIHQASSDNLLFHWIQFAESVVCFTFEVVLLIRAIIDYIYVLS